MGLPPKRTVEHVIELQAGTRPVSVRPYRYPHLHKNEIERQVNELLQQGVISVPYNLKLPPTSKVHPVSQVSQIKEDHWQPYGSRGSTQGLRSGGKGLS